MKSRKGIALPIEMIVIIAIAVLVLVVLAALFIGGTGPIAGRGPIDIAYSTLCADQVLRCGVAPENIVRVNAFDLNQDGTPDPQTTLAQVCALKGITPEQCRKSCGCPS